MAISTLCSVDNLLYLNYFTIIGWIALIFAPFNKLSKYFVLIPALLLSLIYTFTLFQQSSKISISFSDLFYLSKWFTLFQNPFLFTSTFIRIRVIDLYLAQWMVNDFYSHYTFAYSISLNGNGTYQVNRSWTFGRVVFTIILLFTYFIAPVGFLLYSLAKFTFLNKYRSNQRIDFQNSRSLNPETDLNLTPIQMEALNRRSVRFGDKLPQALQKIYHFLQALLGLILLFTIVLPAYGVFIVYCRIIRQDVQNLTAEMKFASLLTPVNKRNFIWHLKFRFLQITTFIEYIPNAKNPVVLFGKLQNYFKEKHNVDYYVFGDGIAVNSHKLVKEYLQDPKLRKGFESLGWHVSSSQATFSDLTTIFLSSGDSKMELSRRIVFQWLHAFPYNLHEKKHEAKVHLSRLVPRQINEKPDEKTVYQAVGEVMFFLATGGELRKHEREAFLDCVNTPWIFFPDWFNFLLVGHHFERRTLNSYYTLLQAFARYADGQAIRAAVDAAQGQFPQIEVLRLIATVFSIAGSAAPAKLAYTVIDRLWKDKQTNVPLFKSNPKNFIKECARLDKVVPMVNVLMTDEIQQKLHENNENITIPENTPIHCSLVNANRDESVFENPNEFNPNRKDLDNLIVWNGVEKDITQNNQQSRPPRYCPGHDLSIDVIAYVAQQFLPLINDTTNENTPDTERKLVKMNFNIERSLVKDRSCYDILDNYTKLVMKLMSLAITESNTSPSRGSDIFQPYNFRTKDLDIIRLPMAKFIPTWDEDEPKGSDFPRRFARWLVNQDFWDFNDCLVEFNSFEQAIQWREKMFSALPVPNVIYENMSSDKAMTQLAFAGCACHYTHRIEKQSLSVCVCGIPGEQDLSDAVYVNDMTGLSTFRVREPFERYGAAAYFDKDYQIIAIYWSHKSRLVRKGEPLWEHVKYVWRSTFFAYITIRDHLIATHLIESNAFVSASRKHLPVDHRLRKFIKPFTYHTVSVNDQAAKSLVNERGLVHRIWAFDYDEFLRVCDYISMNYNFCLSSEYISETMTPEKNHKSDEEWDKIYPIYHDHKNFSAIIENYVENFFRINYDFHGEMDDSDKLPEDSDLTEFISEICKQLGIAGITSTQCLIRVISKLISAGTGIHEHVGQISDYMIDPRFIGAKLQQGKEMQNIQTYSQILVLSVVTGLRMPGLLEDWSHLIDRSQFYEKNLKNYQDFKQKLIDLSKEIGRRNKIRNYPFESFNPKFMECSTSV